MAEPKMTAFVIDPEKQSFTRVGTTGRPDDVHRLIGVEGGLDHLRFGERDMLWVDDLGHVNGGGFAFMIGEYPDPLIGKAAVFGLTDPHGDHCTPHVSIDWLRQNVRFLGKIKSRVIWTKQGRVDTARIEWEKA